MRVPSSTPARDVHRQRALARHAAGAGAGRARIVDHLAAALTARAGALEREEALRVADASGAAAMRAGLRPRAGLGAGAGAGFAGDRRRQPHLGGLAAVGLLQADLHVVAEIGAALAAVAAATGAAHAEDALEQIGERGAEVRAEAMAATALLERLMAEAVIGRALVGVLEDFVGLVDFLEAVLAVLVAGIAVGMPFHRELAERGLELAVLDGALDLQHLVVAPLRHPLVPPRCCRGFTALHHLTAITA